MLVAFRYALRPSGDLTTQHSRPRRKRPALAGAGSATGSSRVHNTSSTASCGACRSKSRAAAIFCWRVVELEAKLRPAGRRRVERGAAVQRCYKQAIAHGLGWKGSVHDEKCEIARSFRFRRQHGGQHVVEFRLWGIVGKGFYSRQRFSLRATFESSLKGAFLPGHMHSPKLLNIRMILFHACHEAVTRGFPPSCFTHLFLENRCTLGQI